MSYFESRSSSPSSLGKPTAARTPSRGMTLVEVLYALGLVTLFTVAVMATMMLSRRTTEYVVRQNIAIEVAQSYSEQIKNMEYADLVLSPATDAMIQASPDSFVIKTRKDALTTDYLYLSAGTPLAVSSLNASTTSCRNEKVVPVNVAANNQVNMQMKFWVWITDSSTEANSQIKMVSIIYAFRVQDGRRDKWFLGTVKSMKSLVPTF